MLQVKRLSERAVFKPVDSLRCAEYDLVRYLHLFLSTIFLSFFFFDFWCKSAYDCIIPGKGRGTIKTDIELVFPEGYYGRITPLSPLASKYHIDICTSKKIFISHVI